jgi:single-stranded-DNA-specific exonuclease
MRFRWDPLPPRPLESRVIQQALGVSEITAACLLARGLGDPGEASAFLAPRLKDLADPFRLPNMQGAVQRLLDARVRGEHVTLFGDYDVDGVTSLALLTRVLTDLGWSVGHYLPDRFKEGYGLTMEAARNCHAMRPAPLLVAVDCGSTAREPIRWLGCQGVEAIVVDHHQPGDTPAEPVALVNPHLGLQDHELCSAGLAFKLAHALLKEGRRQQLPGFDAYDLRPLLDLVALGTVADLVPLVRENRILASMGLQRLATSERPGVVALKEVAGVVDQVRVEHVGFQLGPRLNAAGRLDSARRALDLLLATEPGEARALAEELDLHNRERQAIERTMADDAIAMVRSRFNPEHDYVIVEGHLLWHVGVVGIVASRVLREFHRPTLIIGGDGEGWRGSGRSIPGFDLAAALRECDDLLMKHGGHAMAAGVTVAPDRVDALRERLNRIARAAIAPDQLVPGLRIDASATLASLDIAAVEELGRLEPFGQGNPPIQVLLPSLRNARPPQKIGKEQQHWRLSVTDGRATADCLWWNAGDKPVPHADFDLVAVPSINEFNGRRSVQFKLLDWRPARPHAIERSP